MSDDARLKILIDMILDEKGAKGAIKALDEVKKSQKGTTEESKKHADVQRQNEEATKNLNSQIRTLALTSAAISGPLIAAAKNYVSTVGMAEGTSRTGLAVTYQLEQQWLRVGRTVAKEAIPYVQQFSDYAEKGVAYLEKNPAVAKTGVEVAGLTAGIGGAMAGTSALSGLGAGGLAAGISSLIPPIVVAVASYIAMTNLKIPGQSENVLDSGLRSGGKLISIMAGIGAWGISGGNKNLAAAVTAATGTGLGVNKPGVDPNAPGGSVNSNFVTTQMLQQMRQFQIQERYAQIDYDRQKFVAQRNLNLQLQYADEDFSRNRMRSLRDFNIQFQFSEQMFYRQRAIALRDFNIQLARSEEDYNISRSRAAYDHNFDLKMIMLSGDALQYYYAQRQYNLDKSRAEEDYRRQKSRSQDDFARQQGDQLQEFNLQRQQQLLQYSIQLADQEEDFKIQRKRQLEQYQISLDDMDYQFKLERDRRLEAFKEQILPVILTEEQYRAKMMQEMNVSMINKFDDLMGSFDTTWQGFMYNTQNATIPSHAMGGYTQAGPAILHPGEFVMTAQTTSHAEQVAKGTLTQDKLLSMFNQRGFEYNDNRVFSRGLDSTEEQKIARDTRRIVLEAFS